MVGTIALTATCSSDESAAGTTGSAGAGGSAGVGGSAGNAGASGRAGAASTEGGSVGTGPFAACGGGVIDKVSGAVNVEEYKRQARLWDRATIDCRLGPKFADLNPGGEDPRPSAYEPEHKKATGGFLCATYELSGTCAGNCDYGSTAGQALYAPDDAMAPGVDRIQNYAYEKGVICESILSGGWLGGPRPDPGLTTWSGKLGRPVRLPNAFSQTEFWETNAGIMIFPDGLVGGTGNQTAGDTKPYFELPAHKVPTAVAVTTQNEFAFITVWDTEDIKAQIAVFALRADKPEAFSIPYFALANEAGFSQVHLMGYIDLPDMKTPTAIAVAGDNGNTPGGHVPGFEYGNQTDPTRNFLTSVDARNALQREDYERRVPMAAQIIVASRWENKITLIDGRPLAQFVRSVYFGADDATRQAAAARDVWPFTFESAPQSKPVVVTTLAVPHPTVVRIGNQPSGNEQDLRKPLKAWVGNLDGEVRIFDLSAFAHDSPRPIPESSIKELAKAQAGRNITSMVRQDSQSVLVTSRGDRRIEWVGIAQDDKKSLKVLRTLRDARMDDPVHADSSDRGPVVTVVDFNGKRLLNYRVGATENNGGKPPASYGCGMDGADADCQNFEFGGRFDLPGTPFFVGTTNVN
ncbi:MAG TPA: hypothetical protein VK550_08200 [Polyangiaceae bacterium]|nr:hypothetical protein [Polyangiaceae bacterium]